MGIQFTNLWDNAAVSQRCVIVHGKADNAPSGVSSVIVWFDQFPSQRFPLVDGYFKAFVVLEEGSNTIKFETDNPSGKNEREELRLRYLPIKDDPPVHFVLLLAKDSPAVFDSPQYKIDREGNGVGTAVKKLRTASYMMSAFTQEQMSRNKFGLRSFQPYSEFEQDTLSNRDNLRKRQTTHVHVIRCSKTMAEILDPDVAQQNSKAKRGGDLFGMASDALREYGGPFSDDQKFVQAAVIFMDTKWDKKMKLVRGHAALGGGGGNFRLAIFGSHTLWAWPTCIEEIPSCCLDETKTDTNVVANDANQSGSAWEAMNIGMGAFQHEIGHLLGCPHEPDGIMLRGYLFWNRSFSSLEGYNSRENRRIIEGPVKPENEEWWNRLDVMRFLHHPSFALPGEGDWPEVVKPIVYPMDDGICVRAKPGIYMIDIHVDGNSRAHIEYDLFPEVSLSLKEIDDRLPSEFRGKPVELHFHAAPMEQTNIDDVRKFLEDQHAQNGLRQSTVYGGTHTQEQTVLLPENKQPVKVKIWSSSVLHGIEMVYGDGSTIMFGKKDGGSHDVDIRPGDQFTGIALRCGAWVDGGGVITRQTRTDIWGGPGGGVAELTAPPGEVVRGFKGWFGAWMDGMAILY